MVPFWLPRVVAIACGAIFVFWCEASRTSKLVVGGLVILSLLLERTGSEVARIAAMLLQVGVGIFVLLYLKVS